MSLAKLGLLLLAIVMTVACNAADSERADNWDDSVDTSSSADATSGSSSSTCSDGTIRSCQVELARVADRVSCFRGSQICTNGAWGACELGTITTEVLPNGSPLEGASPYARSVMGYTSTAAATYCTGTTYANACDPQCQYFLDTPSSITVAATSGSTSSSSAIDGILCNYAIYSSGSADVRGATITGNVAAVGDLTIGSASGSKITGDVATCGSLSILTNTNQIKGTTEVQGNIQIQNPASTNTTFYGYGTKYTSSGVAVYVAGVSSATTSSTLWQWTWQNLGPAGIIWGNVWSPKVPGNDSTSYSTWKTAVSGVTTSFSWVTKTRAQVIAAFTDPIFTNSYCSSSTAAAIAYPSTFSTTDCTTAATKSDVSSGSALDPGVYGSAWLSGSTAKLTLNKPGTYTFNNFGVYTSATVDLKGIGSGTYNINICGTFYSNPPVNFTFSDSSPTVTAATVDYTKIHWVIKGGFSPTAASGYASPTNTFPGVFTLPDAAVSLGNNVVINGQIHAKSIYEDTPGAIAPVSTSTPCGSTSTCTATTTELFDTVYTASCPDSTLPYWTYLAWNTTIGSGSGNADAKITFKALQGDSSSALQAVATTGLSTLSPVAVYSATTASNTQVCPLSGGPSSCPVSLSGISDGASHSAIRLRAELAYGGCLATAIKVNSWQAFYTCVDAL